MKWAKTIGLVFLGVCISVLLVVCLLLTSVLSLASSSFVAQSIMETNPYGELAQQLARDEGFSISEQQLARVVHPVLLHVSAYVFGEHDALNDSVTLSSDMLAPSAVPFINETRTFSLLALLDSSGNAQAQLTSARSYIQKARTIFFILWTVVIALLVFFSWMTLPIKSTLRWLSALFFIVGGIVFIGGYVNQTDLGLIDKSDTPLFIQPLIFYCMNVFASILQTYGLISMGISGILLIISFSCPSTTSLNTKR